MMLLLMIPLHFPGHYSSRQIKNGWVCRFEGVYGEGILGYLKVHSNSDTPRSTLGYWRGEKGRFTVNV